MSSNNTALFINQLRCMIVLARVITVSALHRNESRGAHYKPEFPERNDKDWLKTSIAVYKNGGINIEYEEIDVQHIKPVLRAY